MPASAAGHVPGVPFQQRNYENWSYANAQKGLHLGNVSMSSIRVMRGG